MKRTKRKVRSAPRISLRDCGVALFCLLLASAVSAVLQTFSRADSHVPLIFVLAVLMISRFTEGYLLGLISAVLAVLAVNYIFTYPYFVLNFTLTGYPLTFLCFLVVSITTSTLTSLVRVGEKARLMGEREKMRANLLRAISHDLRTPLTSITGSLNAVIENDHLLPSAERKELLADARKDAEWLINMVENLLSITRMEGGNEPSLHKEVQVIEEVMGEAVGRFRKQYPELKVELSVPDEVLFAPMDAMLIEQVVINLLINVAIHGKGATKALLSVRKESGCAVVRVEDDGCGIDPVVMKTLFEGLGHHLKTVREDSVRTMGIGLSVCSTIVAAHGGTMTACNRPEGGARLEFTLPIEE